MASKRYYMLIDFNYKIYRQLLEKLSLGGYTFQTQEKFMQHPIAKSVVLRHDVDKAPEKAHNIARIEKIYNIQASYYFRIVKQSFDKEIIKKISSLGHEIGYHYEDLALCKGDYESALKQFECNLNTFRKIYPVKTICMHGSPFIQI